jgi:acyl-CoA synthetase (AMP-forming)/AMP-acid ligase II
VTYDSKPWLKCYDPGVPENVDIPEISLVERLNQVAEQYPDNPALHFLGVALTYRELMALSDRFAQALIQNGCKPGDVVGIHLPNIPQYVIAFIGVLKAGCAATGVSPLMTPRELAYQLNDSQARALVTLDALFEHRLTAVADQLPHLKIVIVTGIADFLSPIKRFLGKLLKKVPHGKVKPLSGKEVLWFREVMAEYPAATPSYTVTSQDRCLIQYTGGTTGVPKGTVLTHRNMIANLTQVETWSKAEYGKDVILSGFPFFHLAGLSLGGVGLCIGAAQVLIPNPRDTKHIVKEMIKYRPTMLVNVPSLYMMLLAEPGFRKLDFSGLKFCLSGASPFPAESIRELEAIVGAGKLLEVYGMTETSPIVTMNPRFGAKKIGTVGLPVSSTKVRLVDLESGVKPVPVGEEGELIVNGPQVMQEYLNKPEETRIALREHDGEVWLHTGDVARMDEDGYIAIVDRAKDMLNVGGFKVFSREVEEKLYEHPAIEFCAIIGVPNVERPGTDVVKLVVQLNEGYKDRDHEALKGEIVSFARENLSPYKVPKILEFADQIPLTVVGKVDKKRLR